MAASRSTCSPEETAASQVSGTDASQVSGTDAPAKKQKPKATNRMMWDNQKDLILIGEVILARPFQFRQGTRERGKAWQEVADAMRARDYKVDKRAVRDRVTHLMDKYKDKNRKEKAASGIAVEETEEERKIRESVEDLIQEEDIESAPREKGDEEKKKMDGAEMRKRACETYGETQKRHHGESSTTPRRSRTIGSETLGLIQKKLEMDQALRKEELARKREDEERRRQEERERDRRYESLQQQQLEQQQQFQQQQQQLQQQQQQLQQQLLQQQQLMQQQVQQNQTLMMAFLKAQGKRD